jgi:hypothetical protein
MSKTHWSVWVTIVTAFVGWLASGIVIVIRLDDRIKFVEQRLERVIDLCCDEVHKSELKRPVGPHTFWGEVNASSSYKERVEMGQQREGIPNKGSGGKTGPSCIR